jgi:hypothetical protein
LVDLTWRILAQSLKCILRRRPTITRRLTVQVRCTRPLRRRIFDYEHIIIEVPVMQPEGALVVFVHLLNAVYVLIALIHPPHLVVNGPGRLRVLDVARRLLPDPETRRVLLQGARQVVKGRAATHFLQLILDVH